MAAQPPSYETSTVARGYGETRWRAKRHRCKEVELCFALSPEPCALSLILIFYRLILR